MSVGKIYLLDYRNFSEKRLELSEKITLIVGDNASGKTNVLESINLLSTGKSFKAKIEEEMISHEKEIARVQGILLDKSKLEVVLTRGEITVGNSPKKTEKVARKRLLINGVGKRLVDFTGEFNTVLFGPWDMDLVTDSPSVRRKFLDTVLSQVDREYRRASLSYEKGLRQRNKLLYRIREEGLSRSQLLFWNKLLIKNGNYISQKRDEFLDFVNTSPKLNDQEFNIEYDKSAISEGRLEEYRKEEVATATTLVGPHRDDIIFRVKDGGFRDLSSFGSRGEQRMSVLWVKLAEVRYIEDKTSQKPTLLLDDIFSELDHEHRSVVIDSIEGFQTVVTTADPHHVEGIKGVEKIKL